MVRALNKLATKLLGPRPTLGSTQNQQRPPRFHNRLPRTGSLLDLMDLLDGPDHREVQIRINITDILDKANLVPVPTEEGQKLFVVHASKDSALADLESI